MLSKLIVLVKLITILPSVGRVGTPERLLGWDRRGFAGEKRPLRSPPHLILIVILGVDFDCDIGC